jgi:methionyl-tRNA formyltransferase
VSDAPADGSIVGRATSDGPVETVFFGSGSFAVPILDALVAMDDIRVAAVVSAPDRPAGRKAILTPTPVTARARELDLPVLQPIRVRRPEAVDELRDVAPELIVLADYGQLIPSVLLALPPRGFLNLHPSALPRHRGASPIPATILAGDGKSAVTLMVVSEGMDEGPIVTTAPLEVRPDDTAPLLEHRAAEVAADLLRRALPEWLAGRLAAAPQPIEGVTLTRPLRREDGLLDPMRSAVELERQVRAYQPWPGSFIELGSSGGGPRADRLLVWSATVADSEAGDGERVGNVTATESGGLALVTVDGRLALGTVQAAGGRRMDADDFRRGRPGIV